MHHMVSHEGKHKAFKAEIKVVSEVIPISAELNALRMCVDALLKTAIRHRQVLVGTRQTGS